MNTDKSKTGSESLIESARPPCFEPLPCLLICVYLCSSVAIYSSGLAAGPGQDEGGPVPDRRPPGGPFRGPARRLAHALDDLVEVGAPGPGQLARRLRVAVQRQLGVPPSLERRLL